MENQGSIGPSAWRKWEPREIKLLSNMEISGEEIALKINRSVNAVYKKCFRLGIDRGRFLDPPEPPKDLDRSLKLAKELFPMSFQDKDVEKRARWIISQRKARQEHPERVRGNQRRYYRRCRDLKEKLKSRRWAEWELKLLRNPELSVKHISIVTTRRYSAIKKMRERLGVKQRDFLTKVFGYLPNGKKSIQIQQKKP